MSYTDATMLAIKRVTDDFEGDTKDISFTNEPKIDPAFFQCAEGENIYLLFAYPVESNAKKGWWAHILKGSPHDSKVEYQSFLHDGRMAFAIAREKKLSQLQIHAVKVNISALTSLEGEVPDFPVLPPRQTAGAPDSGFVISGGIARTRLFPDAMNHTVEGQIKDNEGNTQNVMYCRAKESWIDLSWQGSKSSPVGYKMIAGTQVCIPERLVADRVRHVATIQIAAPTADP